MFPKNRVGGAQAKLKQFTINLHHLTRPEIKDFNALDDKEYLKLNRKRDNSAGFERPTVHEDGRFACRSRC